MTIYLTSYFDQFVIFYSFENALQFQSFKFFLQTLSCDLRLFSPQNNETNLSNNNHPSVYVKSDSM